jgi:hypothetical protein
MLQRHEVTKREEYIMGRQPMRKDIGISFCWEWLNSWVKFGIAYHSEPRSGDIVPVG